MNAIIERTALLSFRFNIGTAGLRRLMPPPMEKGQPLASRYMFASAN